MPERSSRGEVAELKKEVAAQKERLDARERESERVRTVLHRFCNVSEIILSLLILLAIGGILLSAWILVAEEEIGFLLLMFTFFAFGVLWVLLLIAVVVLNMKIFKKPGTEGAYEMKTAAHEAAKRSREDTLKEREPSTPKEEKEGAKESTKEHAKPAKATQHPRTQKQKTSEKKEKIDIEAIFGGSWLSKTGMAIIVLGVAFFLQLSFTNGWISPPVQILIGAVIGAGLLVGGEWFDRGGHHVFARALTGGGSLILYLSFFAANVIYTVIPDYYIALLLCLITTILTFGLATRYKSVVVAFFGLVGVYAIPLILTHDGQSAVVSASKIFLLVYYTVINLGLAAWLIGTRSVFITVCYLIGAYVMPLFIGLSLELLYVLFGYYVVLNSVLAYISYRYDWWSVSYGILLMGFIVPSLGIASMDTTAWLYLVYAATLILTYLVLFSVREWGWYLFAPLLVTIFAVPFTFLGEYAVIPAYVFIVAMLLSGTVVSAIRSSRILFYIMLVWAIVIPRLLVTDYTLTNDIVYSVFLAVSMLAMITFSIVRRWEYTELLSLLITYPFLFFIIDADHPGLSWGLLSLFFVMYLGAQLYRVISYRSTVTSDVFTVLANGMAVAGLGYHLLDPYHAHLQGVFMGALAIIHFLVGYGLWRGSSAEQADRRGITTYLGVSIGFLLIMFPVQFDGAAVVLLWAASGLVFLWIGLRIRHAVLRVVGGLLFLFALARFFLFDFIRLDAVDPFLTPRSLTFLTLVIFTGIISYLYRSPPTSWERYNTLVLALFSLLLTWGYISYEALMFFRHTPDLAGLLSLTLVWAVYATVLIVIGFLKDIKWLRLASLVVFGVTILKLFALDVWLLDLAFRIMAFIGLGILLLLASFMYSRFKMLIMGEKND